MRVIWGYGKIYSLKLRNDLYTLCQLLKLPKILVYDIKSKNEEWSKNCLENINPLFCVYIGRIAYKLMTSRINARYSQSVLDKFNEPKWIQPHLFSEHPENNGVKYDYRLRPLWLGGRLVQSAPNEDDMGPNAKILNENLKLPEDRGIIEKTELTNMWGANDLQDRLVRYFDTGINRDDMKFFCFPGLWDDIEKLRPLTRRVPVTPGWGRSCADGEVDFSSRSQSPFLK